MPHNLREEVHRLARKFDLPNKDRKNSQGICFLGKGNGAIVVDELEVTRDHFYGRAYWGEHEFIMVDTGGVITISKSQATIMEELAISTTMGMDGIPLAVRETTVARMFSIIERQATAVVEESSVIISWLMLRCARIGQSWFRYREDALRNEPINNRQEAYMAIRKMLETLDDPFTRFWSLKILESENRGVLTGVGLSIDYPTKVDVQASGLVISASPRGPAYRAGVSSGDVILLIDDMELYDAAERL
ncbi:hypothetical protein VNO78_20357 [Psophocarpus tetragonolobus]|uniref:PDZ domain-containing protein n=1 Tax=Psophocarpus tetragonolobus TaxID=3891 RepID=A0AAN9S946_PSOTE